MHSSRCLPTPARAQARQADAEIDAGRYRGPLHGIPISIRDIIDIAGVPTTGRIHSAAAMWRRPTPLSCAGFAEAGAVLVGKNNLHSSPSARPNEDSAFGPARHPLDEIGPRADRPAGLPRQSLWEWHTRRSAPTRADRCGYRHRFAA